MATILRPNRIFHLWHRILSHLQPKTLVVVSSSYNHPSIRSRVFSQQPSISHHPKKKHSTHAQAHYVPPKADQIQSEGAHSYQPAIFYSRQSWETNKAPANEQHQLRNNNRFGSFGVRSNQRQIEGARQKLNDSVYTRSVFLL